MMLFLLACSPDTETAYEAPVADPGEISTVFTVSWTTEEPTQGWVEFGRGEQLSRRTTKEDSPRTEHRIVVAGLTPNESWNWRTVQETEVGEQITSKIQVFETGRAPAELEPLDVVQKPENQSGYLIMPLDSSKLIVIYDMTGTPVWWYNLNGTGFLSQVRLIGDTVWFNEFPKDKENPGNFIYAVSLDQENIQVYTTPMGHHDFLVDKDQLLYIQQDRREGPDGQLWVGDAIVARPVDMLDASQDTVLWSAWDFVDQVGAEQDFYDDALDWTHFNGLAWLPGGEVLVSSKTQEALYAITPEGTVAWVLGGGQATMELQGDPFGIIHGPIYAEDRLWLFDNRPEDRQAHSRVVSYELDLEAGIARQEFSDGAHALETLVHGNGEPTGDGRILGAWGIEGQLVFWDEAGEIVGEFRSGDMGYVHFIPSLGGPVE